MTAIPSYRISAYTANQYSSLFKSLNQKVDHLYEHLNSDFLVTTRKVKKYSTVARKKLQSEKATESLSTKIKKAIRSFDHIMVELQYHDIIRQKLEHIYTVERCLSEEFSDLYEHPQANKPLFYVLAMSDIIELAINQLKCIKEEYLLASNKIQQRLRALWTDREISSQLQLFLFNTSENLRNVIQSIDLLIKMHERIRTERNTFEVTCTEETRMKILNEIKKLYTMESEREIFNATFGITEESVLVEDGIFF